MDTTSLLQTLQLFQLFLQTTTIGVVLYLPLLFIALDLITGCIVAIKQGVFNWKKLADFWGKSLLIYILALFLMLLCFLLNLPQIAIAIASALGMGTFVASTLASILENLKELGASPVVLAEVEQVAEQLVQPLYTMTPPIEVQRVSTPPPVTMQPTVTVPVAPPVLVPVAEQPTGTIIMPTGL